MGLSVVAGCFKVMLIFLVVAALSIACYALISSESLKNARDLINSGEARTGSLKDFEYVHKILKTRVENERFGWSSQVQMLADPALESAKKLTTDAKDMQNLLNKTAYMEYAIVGLISCTIVFLIVSLVVHIVAGSKYSQKGQGFDLVILGLGTLMVLVAGIMLVFLSITTCDEFEPLEKGILSRRDSFITQKYEFEKRLNEEKDSFTSHRHRSTAIEDEIENDNLKYGNGNCKTGFSIIALAVSGGISLGSVVVFLITIVLAALVPPPPEPETVQPPPDSYVFYSENPVILHESYDGFHESSPSVYRTVSMTSLSTRGSRGSKSKVRLSGKSESLASLYYPYHPYSHQNRY